MKKLSKAGAGRYTVKWIFTEPDIKKVLEEIRIEVGRRDGLPDAEAISAALRNGSVTKNAQNIA